MRPQPMTPTLISFSSDPESVMERAERVRKEAADEAEGAKASVEAAQARKRRVEKRIFAKGVGRYEVMQGRCHQSSRSRLRKLRESLGKSSAKASRTSQMERMHAAQRTNDL